MRVGVDLDGVIYDWNQALRVWLGGDMLTHPTPTAWDLWPQWGMTKEEGVAQCDAAVDAGHLFVVGQPLEQSVFWLNQLRTAGHEIVLCTARHAGRPPSPALPGAAEINTRHWLQLYQVPHDRLVMSRDKTVIDADVFIEDSPANYDALDAAGTRAYLITRPWNQPANDGRRRVSSFEEFARDVLALVPATS